VGHQASIDGGAVEGDRVRRPRRSDSPTVLLRISDGVTEIRRAFSDFAEALEAAEAYAGAGFWVAMISATGRFLMDFDPTWPRLAV
jgi:hypothetical protein